MIAKHVSRFLVIVGIVTLAACQSPQQTLVEEGYAAATPQELETWFVGKTVRTSAGKDYYGPGGAYTSHWEGKLYNGTWQIEEPNKICWDVAEWGSLPCGEFFISGDNIVTVFRGREFRRTSADFTEGNTVQ